MGHSLRQVGQSGSRLEYLLESLADVQAVSRLGLSEEEV